MKQIKILLLLGGMVFLTSDLFSQAKLLKTEDGRDYYIISVEMNVRKSYWDLSFHPYPKQLGDDRLCRRRFNAKLPFKDVELDSVIMFDVSRGRKIAYIQDKNNNGLINPNGHEAALFSSKMENDQLLISLLIGNWKHDKNRYNLLEIIYSVPESETKDKIATVVVGAQLPARAISVSTGAVIPIFQF